MSDSVHEYTHDDTTRAHVFGLKDDISGITRAIGHLQQWRAWMLGAVAVLGIVVTLAVASVPWMVRGAVQDVLIEHGILRVERGDR